MRWILRKFAHSLLASGMLLLLLALIGAAYIAVKLFTYGISGDTEHLAEKGNYLQGIGTSVGKGVRTPNIILVLFDDLGYGDLGVYGGKGLSTPNIDEIARSGTLFTHYYAPAPVCTPSRAALLTGRYAPRTGLPHVLAPSDSLISDVYRVLGVNVRLPQSEITLAEVLQSAGYATAAIGKWHLGDVQPSLPGNFGFDYFFGLHYSNDFKPLALWRNNEQIESSPVDQSTLSERYTDEVVAFLENNRDKPFFVYLPHTFPHIPLYASKKQTGLSRAGLYGDVIADLDDSIGRIVDTLRQLDLERETLVIVTSDNGPWFQGSAGALRGRKNDVLEGGMRVPFIAYWPGRISPGRVVDTPIMGIDVFPTILELAGIPLPADRTVDGVSLVSLLSGKAFNADRALFYFMGNQALAVRRGGFKYLDRQYVAGGMPFDLPIMPLFNKGPWLFNIATDESESFDISDLEPKIAQRMAGLLEVENRTLKTNPRGWRE